MNYYCFQRARNVDGEVGTWSEYWLNHFRFLEDDEQFYYCWRNVELSTRKERRSLNRAYDVYYYNLYLQAKNEIVFMSKRRNGSRLSNPHPLRTYPPTLVPVPSTLDLPATVVSRLPLAASPVPNVVMSPLPTPVTN